MSAIYAFASWSKLQSNNDDHWSDRVSHLWTVSFLVLFSTLVSSAQFVGDPIQCWCPAHFTNSFISYTKNICWISNTYYITDSDTIPVNIQERQNKEISYYQWVPVIFLFQAFMFKLPNVIWRMLSNTGGVNINRMVELAESTQLNNPEERDKIIYQVAKYLDSWLKTHHQYHFNLIIKLRRMFGNVFCFWFAKREGKFLVGFYLFIKLLFAANVICQFFILNTFLSMNYTVYGYEVINTLVNEGEFKDSPRFPRVTLCDFEIRQLENLQRYTIQCVLPINLFNEKIFIFLWFWYLFVAVVATASYLSWLFHVFISHKRSHYVNKYLQMKDALKNKTDFKLVKKFANEYLKDDGVFVLQLIAKNSSELMLTDLINSLWILFRESILPLEPVDSEHGQ